MNKVYYIKFKKREDPGSVSEKALKVFLKAPFLGLIQENDLVGIKIHFGEEGNRGYVKPEIVKPIAEALRKRSQRVFITDTNTLYIGRRSNAVDHIKLAEEHKFTLANIGIPVIIADGLSGRNYKSVDINGRHLKDVKIASDIVHADFLLCLSHMTGHMQTGFGATIKNLGMGCASRAGKLEQHSNVLPEVSKDKCSGCAACIKWCSADAIIMEGKKAIIIQDKCIGCGECTVACKIGAIAIKWSESIKNLQEKVAEYALGVIKSIGAKNTYYINFLNHITKDCDCMAKGEPPICGDIGIMASADPVSLDKASVDEILKENGEDVFKKGYPDIDWVAQLRHAEEIGLGSTNYQLEIVE
ncbi:MAG: DUF362 domain-containing protein [Candidatus Omnitrophota bacterium]